MISEYPLPYSHEPSVSIDVTGVLGGASPGPEPSLREQIIGGTDRDVLELAHVSLDAIVGEGLQPVLWARATRDAKRSGVYLNPLIDLCLHRGIVPNESRYRSDKDAVELNPLYQSGTEGVTKISKWLRTFTTHGRVRDLLRFQAPIVREAVLINASAFPPDELRSLVTEHGIWALAPLLRRQNLPRRTSRLVFDLTWDALCRAMPQEMEESRSDPEAWGELDPLEHYSHNLIIAESAAKYMAKLHKQNRLPSGTLRRLVQIVRKGPTTPKDPHPLGAVVGLLQFDGLGERVVRSIVDRLNELHITSPALWDHPSPHMIRLGLVLGDRYVRQKALFRLRVALALKGPEPLGRPHSQQTQQEIREAVANLLNSPEPGLAAELLQAYPGIGKISVTADSLETALQVQDNKARLALISTLDRIQVLSSARTVVEVPEHDHNRQSSISPP